MVYVCRYSRKFNFDLLADHEDCKRLNINTDKGNSNTTSSNESKVETPVEKTKTKTQSQNRRQPRRFSDYNFVK